MLQIKTNPQFREREITHGGFKVHHCIDGILLEANTDVRRCVHYYFKILKKIQQCQTKHNQGNIVNISSFSALKDFLIKQISLLEECRGLMRIVQKLGLNSYYSTISLNRATMLKEILFDLRGLQDLIQEKIVELETKDLKMSVRRVERNAQLGDRPVANTAWSDEDDEVIEQDAWADEDKFVEHCENKDALSDWEDDVDSDKDTSH